MKRWRSLSGLSRDVCRCRICPRLVDWRRTAAADPPRRYAGQAYWARAVPGFGDPEAWLMIVGLAPAAHGANRTGRMFTGDRSGDWLYRALFRAGLANRPESVAKDDGLALDGVYVTASVRCAPPDNRPTPEEVEACRPYLEGEVRLMRGVRVFVALGNLAWVQILGVLRDAGHEVPRPRPDFGHGSEVRLGSGGPSVLASYHPSQQNTFTGKLTEPMFDSIFRRALALR